MLKFLTQSGLLLSISTLIYAQDEFQVPVDGSLDANSRLQEIRTLGVRVRGHVKEENYEGWFTLRKQEKRFVSRIEVCVFLNKISIIIDKCLISG